MVLPCPDGTRESPGTRRYTGGAKRGKVGRAPGSARGRDRNDPGEEARARRPERPERREIPRFLHADAGPEGRPRKPRARGGVTQLRQGAPRPGAVPAGEWRAAREDAARPAPRRVAARQLRGAARRVQRAEADGDT